MTRSCLIKGFERARLQPRRKPPYKTRALAPEGIRSASITIYEIRSNSCRLLPNGAELAAFNMFWAMNLPDFRNSLSKASPPHGLSPALIGLWWDAKGDWDKAHESAQQDEGAEGAWVHAYLHRKEGDQSNAEYWYQRAGKPPARSSPEEEWNEIVVALAE